MRQREAIAAVEEGGPLRRCQPFWMEELYPSVLWDRGDQLGRGHGCREQVRGVLDHGYPDLGGRGRGVRDRGDQDMDMDLGGRGHGDRDTGMDLGGRDRGDQGTGTDRGMDRDTGTDRDMAREWSKGRFLSRHTKMSCLMKMSKQRNMSRYPGTQQNTNSTPNSAKQRDIATGRNKIMHPSTSTDRFRTTGMAMDTGIVTVLDMKPGTDMIPGTGRSTGTRFRGRRFLCRSRSLFPIRIPPASRKTW